MPPKDPRSLLERIAARVVINERGCHIWQGATERSGYGRIGDTARTVDRVHRIVWYETFGPIPDGMEVHHRCEVRACCNPAHLELLTSGEHARLHNPRAGFCKRGHPRSGDNLYISPGGQRQCRACRAWRESQP